MDQPYDALTTSGAVGRSVHSTKLGGCDAGSQALGWCYDINYSGW